MTSAIGAVLGPLQAGLAGQGTGPPVPDPHPVYHGRTWWRNAGGMATVVFIAFFGFNFVIPLLPLYAQFLGVVLTERPEDE